MLTSLNQISPASGNPLSESRLQGLGIRPDQIRFLPPEWLPIVAPLYAALLKGKPAFEKG